MAALSKLIIESHVYTILECEYEFNQAVDVTGRPSDRPRGGLINLVIVSPDDSDLTFHEWMFDKESTKDGHIAFTVNISENTLTANKTLTFEDAYCVRLYEYFNNGNSIQMYTKISIMANSITFGKDCTFKMID